MQLVPINFMICTNVLYLHGNSRGLVLSSRAYKFCVPERRNNSQALVSGLTVQAYKIMLYLTCTMISSVDLAYVMGYLMLKVWVSLDCGMMFRQC